jgi:hypothetical protein
VAVVSHRTDLALKDRGMPSPGLPVGAVNPAGLASPSPPERGGHVKAGAERSGGQRNAAERRPIGLGLDGDPLGGRVDAAHAGDHMRPARTEAVSARRGCRGRQKAVNHLPLDTVCFSEHTGNH